MAAAVPEATSTSGEKLSQGVAEKNITRSSRNSSGEAPPTAANPSETTDKSHDKTVSGHNQSQAHPPSPRENPHRPPKALHVDTGRRSLPPQDGLDPRTGDSGYARTLSVDLEKQKIPQIARSLSSGSSASTMTDSLCADGEDGENEIALEQKAMTLLIYLSGICSIISLLVAAWTLLALVTSLLLQPLRLCSSRMTFRQQLIYYLAPSLTVQLSLIYAHPRMESFNVMFLVIINLLSPLVSIGVAIAAWTAAVFWFYAAVIGDPSGTDKPEGYNDGKAFVLAIRLWWMHWLTKSISS